MKVMNTVDGVQALYKLITGARKHVTLVSPYTGIHEVGHLRRAIEEAKKLGADVTLVRRANEKMEQREIDLMQKFLEQRIAVLEVEELHAKIYHSDAGTLVGSLNLYPFSFNSSIELCLEPTSEEERSQVLKLLQVEILKRASKFDPSKVLPKNEKRKRVPKDETKGYCLRCAGRIPLNTERPYCKDDYAEWATYENEDYEDTYCHGCGDEHASTMAKPLCRSCFRGMKNAEARA